MRKKNIHPFANTKPQTRIEFLQLLKIDRKKKENNSDMKVKTQTMRDGLIMALIIFELQICMYYST